MPQLTGIAITLTTPGIQINPQDDHDEKTDDYLYIGLIGEGGGREFPLGPSPSRSIQTFKLGHTYEPFTGTPTMGSQPGKNNNPEFIPLDMTRVRFVYLRKQGNIGDATDDDAYKLEKLEVVLYGPAAPLKRTFQFFNGGPAGSLWLANENGHVVYLQEIRS